MLYHGIVPIDAGFFLSDILLNWNRKVITVVDRMTQSIPGSILFLYLKEIFRIERNKYGIILKGIKHSWKL